MPASVSVDILKKLHPKLRMIADGDTTVNVVRAERCAALAVTKTSLLKEYPPVRGQDAVAVRWRDLRKKPKTPKRLKSITPDVLTNVFVYLRDASVATPPCGNRNYSRRGQIMQVQTTLKDLPELAKDDSVTYVEIAEALKMPTPVLWSCAPRRRPRPGGGSASRPAITMARMC